MKNLKIFTLVMLVSITLSQPVFAVGEVSETGTSGMSFLKITPTAKIAALGGSSFAGVTGAASAWSNPALIAGLTQRSVEFTHISWVEGIKQESAAFATKSSIGYFALGMQVFDSGDVELRGPYPSSGPDGTYRITNAAFSLSYAKTFSNIVSAGVTAKKLYEKVSSETADGFAIDAGIVTKTPVEGLVASIVARNYGTMSKLKNDETKLPSDIGFGLAYTGILSSLNKPYMLVVDYISPKYGDSGVRAGAEIEAVERFFLRAGYRSDSDIQSVSLGVGIHYQNFAFDVAYTPMTDGFDDTLRFTLGLAGF